MTCRTSVVALLVSERLVPLGSSFGERPLRLVTLSVGFSQLALEIFNDPLRIIQCAVGRQIHLQTLRIVLPG